MDIGVILGGVFLIIVGVILVVFARQIAEMRNWWSAQDPTPTDYAVVGHRIAGYINIGLGVAIILFGIFWGYIDSMILTVM